MAKYKGEMRGSLHCALRAPVEMTQFWVRGGEQTKARAKANAVSPLRATRSGRDDAVLGWEGRTSNSKSKSKYKSEMRGALHCALRAPVEMTQFWKSHFVEC